MIWIVAISLFLFVGAILLCIPYDAFPLALRNTHRGGGERSGARTKRELRHVGRLAWKTLGIPLFVMLLASGAMRAFHLYGMPDNTLAEIYGEYHPEVSLNAPDLEAWADAIEAEHREAAFHAWRQAQGLEAAATPTLQEQLVEHWPIHPIFVILLWAFAAWYLLRVVPHATALYRRGVALRSREYLHRDLNTTLEGVA